MQRKQMRGSVLGILALSLLEMTATVSAQAQEPTVSEPAPPPTAQTIPTPPETPATLTLGDTVILRLRTTSDKMSPQERIDALEQRLARVMSVPDLRPADVAIYAPLGHAPAIYVIGRKLISVDAETTASAGATDPLALATQWAKRLQQVLPFVDWRRPSEHEPVIPKNPPLTIAKNLDDVGGGIGNVLLHDTAVFTLYGIQPGGVTAAERADLLTSRLNGAAFKNVAAGVDPVSVTPLPGGGADLMVNGTRLLTVTPHDARVAAMPTALALATSWAASLRKTMGAAVNPAPPAPAPVASNAVPSPAR